MLRSLLILLAVLAGLLLQPPSATAWAVAPGCAPAATQDLTAAEEAEVEASQSVAETSHYLLPPDGGVAPAGRQPAFGRAPARLSSLTSPPHSPPPRI